MFFDSNSKQTSLGIINFISKAITILAPIFAELNREESVAILMGFCVVSLAVSIFLPSKNDQEEFERRKEEREDKIYSASRSSILSSQGTPIHRDEVIKPANLESPRFDLMELNVKT